MNVVDRISRSLGGSSNGSAPPVAPARRAPRAVSATELMRRRDRLARRFAELQYDLGGLVYEMAIRDHYRLDVVSRQAARLQELDAELGAMERMLALEQAGAAGGCPHCCALHARGASYCASCGAQLLEPLEPAPVQTAATSR